MAFDTQQKRADVLGWLQPHQMPLVVADASLTVSDGQTISHLYSGIAIVVATGRVGLTFTPRAPGARFNPRRPSTTLTPRAPSGGITEG